MTEPKKNTGMRFSSFKLGFSMIPVEWKIELARVFSMGRLKYDRDNWLGGMDWHEMLDSYQRHMAKWEMGLTVDEETGCHHLAQAAWNLLGLMTYEMRGLGTDDRNRPPLTIDADFKWISGPASLMGIGLSKEQMQAIVDKFQKKEPTVPAEEPKKMWQWFYSDSPRSIKLETERPIKNMLELSTNVAHYPLNEALRFIYSGTWSIKQVDP